MKSFFVLVLTFLVCISICSAEVVSVQSSLRRAGPAETAPTNPQTAYTSEPFHLQITTSDHAELSCQTDYYKIDLINGGHVSLIATGDSFTLKDATEHELVLDSSQHLQSLLQIFPAVDRKDQSCLRHPTLDGVLTVLAKIKIICYPTGASDGESQAEFDFYIIESTQYLESVDPSRLMCPPFADPVPSPGHSNLFLGFCHCTPRYHLTNIASSSYSDISTTFHAGPSCQATDFTISKQHVSSSNDPEFHDIYAFNSMTDTEQYGVKIHDGQTIQFALKSSPNQLVQPSEIHPDIKTAYLSLLYIGQTYGLELLPLQIVVAFVDGKATLPNFTDHLISLGVKIPSSINYWEPYIIFNNSADIQIGQSKLIQFISMSGNIYNALVPPSPSISKNCFYPYSIFGLRTDDCISEPSDNSSQSQLATWECSSLELTLSTSEYTTSVKQLTIKLKNNSSQLISKYRITAVITSPYESYILPSGPALNYATTTIPVGDTATLTHPFDLPIPHGPDWTVHFLFENTSDANNSGAPAYQSKFAACYFKEEIQVTLGAQDIPTSYSVEIPTSTYSQAYVHVAHITSPATTPTNPLQIPSFRNDLPAFVSSGDPRYLGLRIPFWSTWTWANGLPISPGSTRYDIYFLGPLDFKPSTMNAPAEFTVHQTSGTGLSSQPGSTAGYRDIYRYSYNNLIALSKPSTSPSLCTPTVTQLIIPFRKFNDNTMIIVDNFSKEAQISEVIFSYKQINDNSYTPFPNGNPDDPFTFKTHAYQFVVPLPHPDLTNSFQSLSASMSYNMNGLGQTESCITEFTLIYDLCDSLIEKQIAYDGNRVFLVTFKHKTDLSMSFTKIYVQSSSNPKFETVFSIVSFGAESSVLAVTISPTFVFSHGEEIEFLFDWGASVETIFQKDCSETIKYIVDFCELAIDPPTFFVGENTGTSFQFSTFLQLGLKMNLAQKFLSSSHNYQLFNFDLLLQTTPIKFKSAPIDSEFNSWNISPLESETDLPQFTATGLKVSITPKFSPGLICQAREYPMPQIALNCPFKLKQNDLTDWKYGPDQTFGTELTPYIDFEVAFDLDDEESNKSLFRKLNNFNIAFQLGLDKAVAPYQIEKMTDEISDKDFVRITPTISPLFSGEIGMVLNYFNARCKLSSSVPVILSYPDKIQPFVPSPPPSDKSSIELEWTIPNSRALEYTTRQFPSSGNTPETIQTVYHKFTIHSIPTDVSVTNPTTFPLISTSYATLTAQVKFFQVSVNGQLSSVEQLSPEWSGPTTLVPETARRALITLPPLPPTLFPNGYIIMMSPVGIDSELTKSGLVAGQGAAIWRFSLDKVYNPCDSVSCQNPSTCNEYTGKCELPSTLLQPNWLISPLIVNSQCSLQAPSSSTPPRSSLYNQYNRCPNHFTPNQSCTQCACTTPLCLTNTRSIQVNLDMPSIPNTGYDQAKYSLIEYHLSNHLSSLLGLNPYSNTIDLQSAWIGTSPPDYKGVPDFDVYRNLGHQTLKVNFMNPTVTNFYDFSTVLITLSITPPAGTTDQPTYLHAHFLSMLNRLTDLISEHVQSQEPIMDSTTHNILKLIAPNSPSFNIKFSSTQQLPRILPVKWTPTHINSGPTTQCAAQITSTSTTVLPLSQCPQPTKSLLTYSPYWSKCDTTSQPQRIAPHCLDYNGLQVPNPIPPWCTRGWHSYPLTTSVPCIGTTQQTAPDTIRWVNKENIPKTIIGGSYLALEWEWLPTHSQIWNIDVLFAADSTDGGYSRVLTTVLASSQTAVVKIPQRTTTSDSAVLTLRCSNKATSISSPIVISVTGTGLCTNVTCSSTREQCNESNGQCECKSGFVLQSDSQCLPICQGLCSTDEDCSDSEPLSCRACSDPFRGDLCQISTKWCGNDNTGNNSQYCHSRGYIPHPSPGIAESDESTPCSTSPCTCIGSWGGLTASSSGCDICTLVEGTVLSVDDQCVAKNTNIAKTKALQTDGGGECTKCICNDGYFGDKCQSIAIRGSVKFHHDEQDPAGNQAQEISLLSFFSQAGAATSSPSTTDGLHFMTDEGRAVLLDDIAISLGLDSQLVEIVSIQQEQVTQQPSSSSQSTVIKSKTNFTTTQFNPYTQTTINFAVYPSQSSTNSNTNAGTINIADLSNIWNTMRDTTQSTTDPKLPISTSQTQREIGTPDTVSEAVLPSGLDNSLCGLEEMLLNGGVCPEEPPKKSSSSTGLIIGVVVGVVVVIGLFIVTILLVKYAKKNEKWCFESPEKQRERSKKSKASNKNFDGTTTIGSGTGSVTMTNLDFKSGTSATSAGSMTGTKTAVDLVLIDDGEKLPEGWSKQQHTVTQDVFYVYIKDGEMKSQRNSPLEAGTDGMGW